MMHSETLSTLATALNKAQATIVGAPKDATNPHFRSNYATLESVWGVAKPALKENGLSVVQMFNGDKLVTTILHTSGEWMRGEMQLYLGNRQDMQALGSAITYARRYSLCAALGIVADEDDDGNAATQNAQQKQAAPRARNTASNPRTAPPAASQGAADDIAATPDESWQQRTIPFQKSKRYGQSLMEIASDDPSELPKLLDFLLSKYDPNGKFAESNAHFIADVKAAIDWAGGTQDDVPY